MCIVFIDTPCSFAIKSSWFKQSNFPLSIAFFHLSIITDRQCCVLVERVQYKAALIVSGCWQGTSRKRLNDELGWESLSDRRWLRRLTLFYKISNGLAPSYLSDHIPKRNVINMELRNRSENVPLTRTDRYENSFFPYTMKAWKNLCCSFSWAANSFACLISNFLCRSPSLNFFKRGSLLNAKSTMLRIREVGKSWIEKYVILKENVVTERKVGKSWIEKYVILKENVVTERKVGKRWIEKYVILKENVVG